MEDYLFQAKYAAIFLRWCVGYLEDAELIEFFGRCKQVLTNTKKKYSRHSHPPACIFVLDNVEDPGVPIRMKKGQLIRDRASLERVFHLADLEIFDWTEPTWLQGGYYPVMLWALY